MLSVISTLYVCSANEPVQSRRWGAGVHSVNGPVSPRRDILRDWTRTYSMYVIRSKCITSSDNRSGNEARNTVVSFRELGSAY